MVLMVSRGRQSYEYGALPGDKVHRTFASMTAFDPVYDMAVFHEIFKQAYNGPPRQLPADLQKFRSKFLQEELNEYNEAVEAGDLAKQLDALEDLVYVALGTAYLSGFDFREGWRRVHRANMNKELANPEGDSRSTRDVKFDIVKPEGWTPPDHGDLVD